MLPRSWSITRFYNFVHHHYFLVESINTKIELHFEPKYKKYLSILSITFYLWFFKCFVLLSRNSRHKTFLTIDLADEIGRRLTMGRCYLNSITNLGSSFLIKIWDFLLIRLIFDEEFEKSSLMACKNCYLILVRKPTYRICVVKLISYHLGNVWKLNNMTKKNL